MKYLIAMFGDQATMVETKSTEWIKDMIRFMEELDEELAASGEKVDSVGLVDPTMATTVRFSLKRNVSGSIRSHDSARLGCCFIVASGETSVS